MSVQGRHPAATITPGAGSGAGPGFPVSGVIFAFEQADLVGGVFTALHNLNQRYVTSRVYNDTDVEIQPDDNDVSVDANTLLVDLTSFEPIAGIWHLIVIG